MTEIWYKTKDPHYYINHQGQVRTFDRCEYMPYKDGYRKVTRIGKVLKPIKMNNGYLYIDFGNYKKTKRVSIHRLMAETFLDKNIDKKHVHHIDGDKENNSLGNLKIMDPKIHSSDHNLDRVFPNKTGYRLVHEVYKNKYRGSIQRSGTKTIYTSLYDNPEDAFLETQNILKNKNI